MNEYRKLDKIYDFGNSIYFSYKELVDYRDRKINKLSPRDEKGRFISIKKLKCPKCGKKRSKDGHDPCIANLPGVEYACCGHGLPNKQGYITFENGIVIRGNFKMEKKR